MEISDKDILRNVMARKVGKLVFKMLSEEPSYDGDLSVHVMASTPTCYIGDDGEIKKGRVIVVNVEFLDSEGEEEDED